VVNTGSHKVSRAPVGQGFRGPIKPSRYQEAISRQGLEKEAVSRSDRRNMQKIE